LAAVAQPSLEKIQILERVASLLNFLSGWLKAHS
jgi:hypothetical protein